MQREGEPLAIFTMTGEAVTPGEPVVVGTWEVGLGPVGWVRLDGDGRCTPVRWAPSTDGYWVEDER